LISDCGLRISDWKTTITLLFEKQLSAFSGQLSAKSLSLNKILLFNPPLKKGDIGGFALDRFGKIPPTPLYKGGNIIHGQALKQKQNSWLSAES
jgi:hypothetical protein